MFAYKDIGYSSSDDDYSPYSSDEEKIISSDSGSDDERTISPSTLLDVLQSKSIKTAQYSIREMKKIELLAAKLKQRPIINLHLVYANLNDKALIILAKGISACKNMAVLNLGGNKLTDASIEILLNSLTSHDKLSELYLNNNNFSAKSIKSVNHFLRTAKSLNILSLGSNPLGDDGAIILAEALKEGIPLQRLKLYNCQITDKGAKALFEAIKQNTNIIQLGLDLNDLSPEITEAIISQLEKNQGLSKAINIVHDEQYALHPLVLQILHNFKKKDTHKNFSVSSLYGNLPGVIFEGWERDHIKAATLEIITTLTSDAIDELDAYFLAKKDEGTTDNFLLQSLVSRITIIGVIVSLREEDVYLEFEDQFYDEDNDAWLYRGIATILDTCFFSLKIMNKDQLMEAALQAGCGFFHKYAWEVKDIKDPEARLKEIHKEINKIYYTLTLSKLDSDKREQLYHAMQKAKIQPDENQVPPEVIDPNAVDFPKLMALVHALDIEATDIRGYTPLHTAAWRGNQVAIEFLLKHGANIQAVTQNGDTLLHIAVNFGHFALVQWLVETLKLDVLAKNNQQQTALDIAIQRPNLLIIHYLKENVIIMKTIEELTNQIKALQELVQKQQNVVEGLQNQGIRGVMPPAKLVNYLVEQGKIERFQRVIAQQPVDIKALSLLSFVDNIENAAALEQQGAIISLQGLLKALQDYTGKKPKDIRSSRRYLKRLHDGIEQFLTHWQANTLNHQVLQKELDNTAIELLVNWWHNGKLSQLGQELQTHIEDALTVCKERVLERWMKQESDTKTGLSQVPKTEYGKAFRESLIFQSNTLFADKTAVKRVGLFRGDKNDAKAKKALEKVLPNSMQTTVSLGAGDCFFDSSAQSLSKGHTAKDLRLICHKYVVKLDKKPREENWIYQRFLANAKRLCASDEMKAKQAADLDYQNYMANIRYTAEEIARGEDLNIEEAIWGEQDIDGRILREVLGVNLHVVEVLDVNNELIISHQLNGKSVDEASIDYAAPDTIHIAVYNNHFVPILPSDIKPESTLIKPKAKDELPQNSNAKPETALGTETEKLYKWIAERLWAQWKTGNNDSNNVIDRALANTEQALLLKHLQTSFLNLQSADEFPQTQYRQLIETCFELTRQQKLINQAPVLAKEIGLIFKQLVNQVEGVIYDTAPLIRQAIQQVITNWANNKLDIAVIKDLEGLLQGQLQSTQVPGELKTILGQQAVHTLLASYRNKALNNDLLEGELKAAVTKIALHKKSTKIQIQQVMQGLLCDWKAGKSYTVVLTEPLLADWRAEQECIGKILYPQATVPQATNMHLLLAPENQGQNPKPDNSIDAAEVAEIKLTN